VEWDAVPPLVLIVPLVAAHYRRLATPFLLAAVAATLANLPRFIPTPDATALGAWTSVLTHPSVAVIGNAAAGLLAVWGLVMVARSGSPQLRLARSLEWKKDYFGAAEIYHQTGDTRRALHLFKKARVWEKAARVALERGNEEEAADLYRRAGGRQLAEASRVYRQLGDRQAAVRCNHQLAEWLTSEGHFEEAIEAWLRAGELQRALRATSVALSENRLHPSHSAFGAARRAAEETNDARTLARLYEVEGNWQLAAYAWRNAEEHGKAAENFRKASLLDEAARSEATAGRPREAAQLRLRQLQQMQQRLRANEASGVIHNPETDRLKVQVRQETDSLIPHLHELGMQHEMIEVLRSSGRTEEAVARLVAENLDAAAADIAQEAQRWDLAAPILERLSRWSEASDVYELAGNMKSAARCAERAGEDERALQIYRSLGMIEQTAHCLARLGSLQDALIELHRAGRLREACEILRSYPGPVPDIPDVILDMANQAYEDGEPRKSIACLQRAVVGVALQPGRLDPAVALARLLREMGEIASATAQLDRVLAFDFSHESAQALRKEIESARARPDPSKTQPAGEALDLAEPPPPDDQHRYEILTELGRGGMGVVYKARDTRLERDVAIKVLRTTSAEEAARLEQEARAAATLNHPGIVTVYDFQAGFDGYFITMEYVPGDALDQLLQTHPDRVHAHLREILVRLADAIAYAHRNHVIHRDLKPGNILLSPLQEVKILDFGIAARLDSAHDSSSPTVCGTPYYMAPEQIRGESPTPATDVYSFGATAFHLATGEPPFRKGNIIEAHLKSEPPDPAEVSSRVSPELAKIILRCLRKQPGERFGTADELRDALTELPTAPGGQQ
jgi:tRNA A-37 threonylcarbamoyl transferase component Bud32